MLRQTKLFKRHLTCKANVAAAGNQLTTAQACLPETSAAAIAQAGDRLGRSGHSLRDRRRASICWAVGGAGWLKVACAMSNRTCNLLRRGIAAPPVRLLCDTRDARELAADGAERSMGATAA